MNCLDKCTGSFQEDGGSPPGRPSPGTKCVGQCINDSGRWGKSYCYIDQEKSQWGAECIDCPDTADTQKYGRYAKITLFRYGPELKGW